MIYFLESELYCPLEYDNNQLTIGTIEDDYYNLSINQTHNVFADIVGNDIKENAMDTIALGFNALLEKYAEQDNIIDTKTFDDIVIECGLKLLNSALNFIKYGQELAKNFPYWQELSYVGQSMFKFGTYYYFKYKLLAYFSALSSVLAIPKYFYEDDQCSKSTICNTTSNINKVLNEIIDISWNCKAHGHLPCVIKIIDASLTIGKEVIQPVLDIASEYLKGTPLDTIIHDFQKMMSILLGIYNAKFLTKSFTDKIKNELLKFMLEPVITFFNSMFFHNRKPDSPVFQRSASFTAEKIIELSVEKGIEMSLNNHNNIICKSISEHKAIVSKLIAANVKVVIDNIWVNRKNGTSFFEHVEDSASIFVNAEVKKHKINLSDDVKTNDDIKKVIEKLFKYGVTRPISKFTTSMFNQTSTSMFNQTSTSMFDQTNIINFKSLRKN